MKIYNILKNTLGYGLSIVARCFPIKSKDIVFASFPDFSDNAWVLYKHLKNTRQDLRLYWVVNQNHIPSDLDEKYILKNKGIDKIRTQWRINRAGFLLHTHGISSPKIKSRRQKNIYLNHGGCPIKGSKSMGFSHPSRDYKVKNPYDYILCRGEESVKYQALFSCCEEDIILPLGMMRDDAFISNIGDGNLNPLYDGFSKKVIIWMPTFRRSISSHLSENNSATITGLPLLESNQDIVELNKYLKKKGVQLLVKIHPLQEDSAIFKETFSNIQFITRDFLEKIGKQTYEIIGYSDALLTDYSSVYFDYLIADKPIGFILDDINLYEKDRGFVIDNPIAIMAGSHIYTLNQLYEFFDKTVRNCDEYKEERHQIKDEFVGEIPQSTCQKFIEYFNI